MRHTKKILIVLLALSLAGNVVLYQRAARADDNQALSAKTVPMSWTFDWQTLPDQTVQQALLRTPWRINQQIGLWLFGIDTTQYREASETDDIYAEILARYGQEIGGDGVSQPGVYVNERDPNQVFVCMYCKADGAYTGYQMQYNAGKRMYEIAGNEVKNGIIIALE